MPRKRNICFVTGTRAEFGLMRRNTSNNLQADLAIATGSAMAGLAKTFDRLQSDIVLVVGDRVEAFAAASAAYLSGRIVAHVHGGDRAAGQVDDTLRHAITKLSHIHFPATIQSARRIARLGEDQWRIHRVGSPGVESITSDAAPRRRSNERFALLVSHPQEANERIEARNARMVYTAVEGIPFDRMVIVYPNNDPGSRGIIRQWDRLASQPRLTLHRSVPRDVFLGLLRDAVVLIGNSSSGIIEAASFGTPVVDIGSRQLGRERSQNVTNVPYRQADIAAALDRIWNHGHPRRTRVNNIYSAPNTSHHIARILATAPLDQRLSRKLIAY